MRANHVDRRRFLQEAAAGATGLAAASSVLGQEVGEGGTLAALGGKPVRTKRFPSWPIIGPNDREAWQKVLQEGKWFRMDGKYADMFEKVYAERMGTKHCVATANGTSALFAALNALGIGPGDEVLVPPYTFVATINVVLLQRALPIFIDTDRQTFQIDATKMESAINGKTACILPVHLGGNTPDMDTILALAKKHSLPVIEDACQAHLGEWRRKKVGSLGTSGCFSFQVSKNLSSGEGGAIITNDEAFAEKCFAFHNNGHARGGRRSGLAYPAAGANLRMTEFQACLLLQQMTRLEDQSRTREDNAGYLTRQLQEIRGISPAKSYGGCTRNAYHLYMFRYAPDQFSGATRNQFLKALRAEGVPCSSGYTPLNKEPFLKEALSSRAYRAIYSEERLKAYEKNNHCPENDRLCEEAVWFTQTMFLGKRSDMDDIAGAIRKIHRNRDRLGKV